MQIIASSLLLLTVVHSAAAIGRDKVFAELFPDAALGGRCGRFRGCQVGNDCVEGLNMCLPVDCIAEAIKTIEPTLNALSANGMVGEISAQVFNATDNTDTEATATQVANAMMQVEAELARCPGTMDSMQTAGITPFVGGSFEIQVVAQFHVLVALTPRGILQGRCRGRGFGAEVAATAVFGALFTDDVSGTWKMIEIADIIPTVLEVPYFFIREEDSAIGIAFGVGTALGFDLFSQSTCEFSLTEI